MADFVHYVRRRLAQPNYLDPGDPWFAANPPDGQGFLAPAFHVTRQRGYPADRVRRGDTIWLFSQLATPWGPLPPALDARIHVEFVTEQEVRVKEGLRCAWRFVAAPGSMWFPLARADKCLSVLKVRDKGQDASRKLMAGNTRTVGQALQGMRLIDNPDVLHRHVADLELRGFDFISYRLIDGTRQAFDTARALLDAGRPVFWDRWSLPRRIAERREFVRDADLDAVLMHHIDTATRIHVIDSPRYGEAGSYSRREFERIPPEKRVPVRRDG